MQYVHVTANNHAEAIKKLRQQYGSEVIIYGERWIKSESTLSKIIGKKQFKIEAAIPEKKRAKPQHTNDTNQSKDFPASTKSKGSSDLISKSLSDLPMTLESEDKVSGTLSNEKKTMLDMIRKNHKIEPMLNPPDSLGNLQSYEIIFLRNFIAEMSIPTEKAINLYPPEIRPLYRTLQRQDFTHKFIDMLLKDVYNKLPQNQWNVFPVLYKKIADTISDRIKTSSVFHKRAVALVGTTGVGKTTMLAKIAADLKLKKKQTVSIITLDNYRVAATEQIKTYANIIDIPIYVCKEAKKLKSIFVDDNSDIFLIDTAGLSHKNDEFLMRQNDALDALDYDIERHLILSAGSKPEDVHEIMDAFTYLRFDRVIISKIDETNRFGHLVEASHMRDKAFSFFSTGQKVPDDYRIADNHYLIDQILRGWRQ